MTKLRMFQAVEQDKLKLPLFVLPLLALVFLVFGQLLGALLGLLVGQSNAAYVGGDQYLVLASFGFISGLVLLWVKCIEERSVIDLGFYKEGALKEFILGSIIGFVLYSTAILTLWALGAVTLVGTDVRLSSLLHIVLIFPFWLLQGGTEELLVRGWLLPMLTYRSRLLVGITISSLFFAVLHLANPGITLLSFLNLVLFGLFTALYLIDRDSIWGLVAIHGVWNFAQGNLYGVEVSGLTISRSLLSFESTSLPEWLTGGAFGTEGSIVTTILLLLASGLLYRRLLKKNRI